MIKIKLKSSNFEKLQRCSVFARKSEQISLKSAKVEKNFEKMHTFSIYNVENAKKFDEMFL